MDWHKWHGLYDNRPVLQRRLSLVRKQISRCLDTRPPGDIRIVSICAGDGRDLLGVLQRHPRRQDVYARLIELDADLILQGETMRDALGLSGLVEFVNGDATDPDYYRAIAPVDVVIMCGMLGLVEHAELPNIVHTMQALCHPGGSIIWTRRLDWREGRAQTDTLQTLMSGAGFRAARYKTTSWRLPFTNPAKPRFAVGTSRFGGQTLKLPDTGKLFAISSAAIDG